MEYLSNAYLHFPWRSQLILRITLHNRWPYDPCFINKDRDSECKLLKEVSNSHRWIPAGLRFQSLAPRHGHSNASVGEGGRPIRDAGTRPALLPHPIPFLLFFLFYSLLFLQLLFYDFAWICENQFHFSYIFFLTNHSPVSLKDGIWKIRMWLFYSSV